MSNVRAAERTPAEWRASAAECSRRSQESWERSDTDGFLSQWANDLHAQLCEEKARIAEHGGVAVFPALFDSTGARVPAVLVSRPAYGRPWVRESVWCVEDGNGRAVQWVAYGKSGKRSKLFQLGYTEGTEEAPADARITGSGRGLSGRAWVTVVRLDGGYPGRDSRCPVRVETE